MDLKGISALGGKLETETIFPVILAGGVGERLWPLSRKSYPKQFLKFRGMKNSFFQETILRVSTKKDNLFLPPIIFTHEDYRFLVREQLQEINVSEYSLILEPDVRNTAPTFFAACEYLKLAAENSQILFLPSDHVIKNSNSFISSVKKASKHLNEDQIFTFGINPTKAEIGFGYIKAISGKNSDIFVVDRFTEKPNRETAEKFITEGSYFWNSGLYLCHRGSLVKKFEQLEPDIVKKVCIAMKDMQKDLEFNRLDARSWSDCKSISIDYAIVEKSENIYMVPLKCGWTDMGSWQSVWHEAPKDKNNSVSIGSVTSSNCLNSLMIAEGRNLELVAVGLSDMVVVATDDAVYVSNKFTDDGLKEMVSALKKSNKTQATDFNKDFRPWGYFDTLIKENNFHVKRICVNPKQRLSLQSHERRSEHWVVVKGVANVHLDGQDVCVEENQSIYIPRQKKHRIENRSDELLIIIEVQTGGYLEEDDIIRYEDDYSRS